MISSLPNMTLLVPSTVTGGKVLQGTVGNVFITLRLDGKAVTTLPARQVHDRRPRTTRRRTASDLRGPGVSKQTSVRGTGRSTWTLTLKKGKYLYSSITQSGEETDAADHVEAMSQDQVPGQCPGTWSGPTRRSLAMNAATTPNIAATPNAPRAPTAWTSRPPVNAETENAMWDAPSSAANTRLRTSSAARAWISVTDATSPSPCAGTCDAHAD